MPRLFAALEIPYNILPPLALLRGGLPEARWIEPADYHITLRFYGDVGNETADEIAAALDRVEFAPFMLRLKGVHLFSPKKPHTLYAEVERSDELFALQEKIEHISLRAVPPETRKFTPHMTLARLKQTKQEDLIRWLASRSNFETPFFSVKRFCLMSSKESVGGGPYIIEEAWDLTKS